MIKLKVLKNWINSNYKSWSNLKAFFILALTIWIAHFWYSGSFGLYEDDYNRVSKVFDLAWAEIGNYILHFSNSQGRPLHDGLIYLLSFLGFRLGGLQSIYWIGYVIITINTFLFYLLLKRLSANQFFAMTGALAFCLFPADTTKPFLTHSLGIQPSLTFLLAATHCYLSQKKILSYGFILGSLLCYETIFPVFLAVPLLQRQWDLKLRRELLRHIIILGGMIISIVIIRKLSIGGVGVIKNLDFISTIRWSLSNQFYGPFISISMFFYRPFQALLYLLQSKGELIILISFCLAGFVWVLSRLDFAPYRQNVSSQNSVSCSENFNYFQHLTKLTLVGFILLTLAYPLTLTELATEISGRASRVHVAAAIGASIIVACACSAILLLANRYRLKNLAAAILAAFFALLIGFGIMVQQDYQRSWQYQRAFWTDVIHLAPDLTDGTVILVDALLPWGEQIHPFAWSMPSVVGQLYQFPWQWKNVPKLYKLNPDWQQKISANGEMALNNDNGLLSYYYTWESPRQVKTSEIILLQEKDGKLVRTTTPIVVGTKKFSFKPLTNSTLDSFEKAYLYDYLISPNNKKSVNYFQPF